MWLFTIRSAIPAIERGCGIGEVSCLDQRNSHLRGAIWWVKPTLEVSGLVHSWGQVMEKSGVKWGRCRREKGGR